MRWSPRYGMPTVDAFATAANAKRHWFFTRSPLSHQSFGDAFLQTCLGTLFYVSSVSTPALGSTEKYSQQDVLPPCDTMVATTTVVSTSTTVVTEGTYRSSYSSRPPVTAGWEDSAQQPRFLSVDSLEASSVKFSPEVLHLLLNTRKPTTRWSYLAKWRCFSAFATCRFFRPSCCSIAFYSATHCFFTEFWTS